MPKDCKGQQLKPGDLVSVHCRVLTVKAGQEKFENVVLETIEPHYPYEPSKDVNRKYSAASTFGVNGRQCEKTGESEPDPKHVDEERVVVTHRLGQKPADFHQVHPENP